MEEKGKTNETELYKVLEKQGQPILVMNALVNI